MIARRQILFALGASSVAGSPAPFAQQPAKLWRIGVLSGASRPASLEQSYFESLRAGLRERGHTENKDFSIDWRFADGGFDRLSTLAAELVQARVDIIVAMNTPAVQAAQQATNAIPIVMVAVGDPVGSKFISSLARPGGNITGVTNIIADLGSKHLELLRIFNPRLAFITFLLNPANALHPTLIKNIQASAKPFGITVSALEIADAGQIEAKFARFQRRKNSALIAPADSLFISQRKLIADLAVKHALPSMFFSREQVVAGGLMSYAQSLPEQFKRAAYYVDRIVKGAKPASLPVEQPTRLELVVNAKTAKLLGIKIPPEMILRADEVIE